LATYALSGALAPAYEVVWTPILAGIFPGNVYAFTIMLCAILAGLAIGGWVMTPLIGRRTHWPLLFALLEVLLGLAAVFSLIMLGQAYRFEAELRSLVAVSELSPGALLEEP